MQLGQPFGRCQTHLERLVVEVGNPPGELLIRDRHGRLQTLCQKGKDCVPHLNDCEQSVEGACAIPFTKVAPEGIQDFGGRLSDGGPLPFGTTTHVPKQDRRVLAPRSQRLAVRRKGDGRNHFGVPLEAVPGPSGHNLRDRHCRFFRVARVPGVIGQRDRQVPVIGREAE